MTLKCTSLYDVPVRQRIFLLLFILGIAASWTALRLYKGCSYVNSTITGTVYREVWNKENQAVLEPSNRSVRILLTGLNVGAYNGKKIAVTGSLIQPKPAGNPRGYSQRDYLYGKNVLLIMEAESAEEIPDTTLNIRAMGSRVRAYIEKTMSGYMDEQDMNFLMGVMTGDTSGLSDSEKDWVRLSGISHLMAVSGMHVTYILMPVKCLVRRRRINIALRSGLCLIPLAVFTAVAGFTPSVIRAAVMWGCDFVAKIINRKTDFLNTFGFAGCICLLVYPMGIADTGFILSFGAVLSGHILSKPLKEWMLKGREGKSGAVLDSLCYGLSVNIGLLPVMLYQFNMISLTGLLINIAAAPLSAAMCILGYFTCIIGAIPFVRIIAEITSRMLTAVTGALTAVAGGGAAVPVLRSISPPLWIIFLYYGIIGWLLYGRRYFTGAKLTAAAVCLSILCISIGIYGRVPVRIIWFDVGQGSCALIHTENGSNMLIDGGNGYTDVSGLLWKNGVSYIDYVVLSHGDSDHCQGLHKVLEEHEVGCLLIADNPEDENALVLAAKAEKKGTRILKISQRSSVMLADHVTAELYSGSVKNSLNNSSVVVQLVTDFGCVLFPGDLEQEGEQLAAESHFFRQCDTVTAAHHGASNGTGDLLLAYTKPYFTVISAGKNNIYGHPAEKVLERLQERNIEVMRTDRDGAVIMSYAHDRMIGVEKWLKREKLQYRK